MQDIEELRRSLYLLALLILSIGFYLQCRGKPKVKVRRLVYSDPLATIRNRASAAYGEPQ